MTGSLVVFADVDGVLCDRSTSSFEESAAAIDLLSRRAIPLVLCSGKTRAQLESTSQLLGMRHPFICEGGAALFMPDGYFSDVPDGRDTAGYHVVEFGRPYAEVVQRLHALAAHVRVDVVGFSDMSTEQVALECGLSLIEARLAKLREYDEPFRLVDADCRARERLVRAIRAANLGSRRGEHFDHVGARVDCGAAVELLCALYRQAYGDLTAVGFGVTESHLPLLRAVDRPFVLREKSAVSSATLVEQVPAAQTVVTPGPAGWAEVTTAIVRAAHEAAITR